MVAQFEADAELAAMFAQYAAGIGLEWNPLPCLECLRLNDWFLGLECSSKPSRKCIRSSQRRGRLNMVTVAYINCQPPKFAPLCKYAFLSVSLITQILCKVRKDGE